jgi:hypothetical protein
MIEVLRPVYVLRIHAMPYIAGQWHALFLEFYFILLYLRWYKHITCTIHKLFRLGFDGWVWDWCELAACSLAHRKDTIPKIRNKDSQKRNCAALVPISTFMCLWAMYMFPWSVCLFFLRKICGPILEIYKSLSGTCVCANWDWSRAVPRKGINKLDLPCSAWGSRIDEFYVQVKVSRGIVPFSANGKWQVVRTL